MASRFFPPAGRPSHRLTLEVLEGRECPTVTATFASGVLTVLGDGGPNQVSVVELGGGAVEVIGDGQKFSPFAGVESIVIETLDGDDLIHVGQGGMLVALADGSVRLLSIDAGAGDDTMILRDPGPEPANHALHFAVKLRGNNRNDFFDVELNNGSQVSLNVSTTGGGDDIKIQVLQRSGSLPVVVPDRIETTLDLRGGGNVVNLATGPAKEVAVNVTTSDRVGAAEPMLADRYSFSFDGAARTGPFLPSRLKLTEHLSGADDQVKIQGRGCFIVSTDIDTGAGNDWVMAKYRTVRPRPSDPPTEFAFNARLGDGDDRLNARVMGFDVAGLTMDLGTGNDQGRIVLWVRDVTADPTLNVDAQLGAGDDSFRLSAHGYLETRADLDFGPVGDGRDSIAASFVLPGAPERRRNLITLTSMDLDRLFVLGSGYATANVHVEGQHCLVFFLGGLP